MYDDEARLMQLKIVKHFTITLNSALNVDYAIWHVGVVLEYVAVNSIIRKQSQFFNEINYAKAIFIIVGSLI